MLMMTPKKLMMMSTPPSTREARRDARDRRARARTHPPLTSSRARPSSRAYRRPRCVRESRFDGYSSATSSPSTLHTRARRATRAPSTAMDVVIVKLGGAALTVKSRRGTIDARGFADCVETVARAHATGATRLIVAHGAGSFGHGA
jgi:hypothetical protein